MSGAGGGGWDTPVNSACETLTGHTVLNSPVGKVLAKLKKGDLLDVVLRPVAQTFVVEAHFKGQVAGAITSAIIQRLAECIEEGHEYVAEVTENVQGGACRVHVRAK